MKKFWLVIILLSGITKAQVNNYQVGDIVNDFTVTDIYGNQYSLYQLTAQGKYVYIDFFYTSCAACQNAIPVINEFWDKYGCGANEIFCLAINRGYDDDTAVTNFENQYGGNFNHCPAVSSDGGALNVTNAFGVRVFPTVCMIAPDNKLLNNDIRPLDNIRNLENTFPSNLNPQPTPCSSSIENNRELLPRIFIKPNNEIVIKLNVHTDLNIKIFDLTGKLLLNRSFYSDKININDLQNLKGFYILQISSKQFKTINKKILF